MHVGLYVILCCFSFNKFHTYALYFFFKLNFSHLFLWLKYYSGLAKIFIEICKWILLNTFKVVFLLIQGHVKLMNPLKNLYLKVFKLKQIAKKGIRSFYCAKILCCMYFLSDDTCVTYFTLY